MEKVKTKISKQDKEHLEQWEQWQDNYFNKENLEEKERLWSMLKAYHEEKGLIPPAESSACSLMYFAFMIGINTGKEELHKEQGLSFFEFLRA